MYLNWEKPKNFIWLESKNLQEAVVEGEKNLKAQRHKNHLNYVNQRLVIDTAC